MSQICAFTMPYAPYLALVSCSDEWISAGLEPIEVQAEWQRKPGRFPLGSARDVILSPRMQGAADGDGGAGDPVQAL